jgi:predicted secreted hydrolase
VEAALDDQRMDTLLTYWEGLVRVFDQSGARVGSGYLELTGYG